MRARPRGLAAGFAFVAVAFAALFALAPTSGCGASNDDTAPAGGGGSGANTHGTGGTGGFNIGQGGMAQQGLTIQPQAPTLVYMGSPVTQQFTALVDGETVQANWAIDNVDIGTIDVGGLFTAQGVAAGSAKITATYGAATGSTTVTVKMEITENPGNVSAGDIALLQGGGSADPSFKWLYPYDKTVFPRGLVGPTLQFAGSAPTAVWVHAESTSKAIVYDGYFGASNPARVDFPGQTWTTLSQSVGGGETLEVSVTKLVSGQVTGPIKETWSFAQAKLKGTVYYNSYNSQLANGIGAVLKMKPGENASILSGGNGKCTVCHTVAANGGVLLASNNDYSTGAKYDLANNAAMSGTRNDYAFNFPAVFPDGSIALSTSGQHIGGMWGSAPSKLYDVASGAQIPAPGFDGVVTYAAMPAFAPDGKKIAFNWEDQGGMHSLAVMDFDIATKTFSNIQTVANDPSHLLGWPSFLPDGKAVLFDVNDGDDYGTWFNYRADLAIADTATQTVTKLDLLNGWDNGQNYLPFGADDAQRNFEPTVLPVAVGGYYWVIFTSRRQYGNTINATETGNYGDTPRKKLWIAAIDINPQPGKDPSHPPIYLPGQELNAGNMRGFWVLDPCKQDGNSCESGDECCGGYCQQVNGEKVCKPTIDTCAQEFDKCDVDADCCGVNDGYLCINGHCAQPPPN